MRAAWELVHVCGVSLDQIKLLSSNRRLAGSELQTKVKLMFAKISRTITEKAPTRAFSWLKVPTSAFTFKTLLRHYAKRALTPR